MGRFNYDEAENYGGNGGSSYFSLRNDGDIARVRFMYNNLDDVVGYAVHQVEIGDKKRYVNCLRDYNEPKSKCPFCAANNFQKAKLYIPIFDMEDEEVKLWERGKNYFAKISSLCARYSKADTPLVSHVFEIERHGKKGDTGTQYEVFEVSCDDTRLDDLPEIPNVLGTVILDKTAEDMEYFLDNEEFPADGAPKRERREESHEEQTYTRRTPSRSRDTTNF